MMKLLVLSVILFNLIVTFDLVHGKNAKIKKGRPNYEEREPFNDEGYFDDQLADETVATNWPSNRIVPIQKGSDGKNKYVFQISQDDEIIVDEGNTQSQHEVKNVQDVKFLGNMQKHESVEKSGTAKDYVTSALQYHDNYHQNDDQEMSNSNLAPIGSFVEYSTANYGNTPGTVVKQSKQNENKPQKFRKPIIYSTTAAPKYIYTTKNQQYQTSDVMPSYDYSTPKVFTSNYNTTKPKTDNSRSTRPMHAPKPITTALHNTAMEPHEDHLTTIFIKPKNTRPSTAHYLNNHADNKNKTLHQYNHKMEVNKSETKQVHDDNRSFYLKPTESKRFNSEETVIIGEKKKNSKYYQMTEAPGHNENNKLNNKVSNEYRTFENDVSDPVVKPIYVATYPNGDSIDKLSYHDQNDPDDMAQETKNQQYFVLYHIDEKKPKSLQLESSKQEMHYNHHNQDLPDIPDLHHQYHHDTVLVEEPELSYDSEISNSDFIKIIDAEKPSKTVEITKDDYARHIQQAALRYMKDIGSNEKLNALNYEKPKTYYRIIDRPIEAFEPPQTSVSKTKYNKNSDSYHLPSKTVISVLPSPTPSVTYKTLKPTPNSYKIVTTLKLPKNAYTVSKPIKLGYDNVQEGSHPQSHIDLTVKNMKSTSKPDLSAIDVGQSYMHDSPFDHGAALKNVQGFDLSNAVHASGQKSPKTKLHFNQQTYHDINALTNSNLNVHLKEREPVQHNTHMITTSTLKPGYYKGYTYGEPSSFQTVKGGTANVGASISFGGKLPEPELDDSSASHTLDSPIQIINGIPVSNPYNVDMNTLRYMLGGIAQVQVAQTPKESSDPYKLSSSSNWNTLGGTINNPSSSHQPYFEHNINSHKYINQENYANYPYKITTKTKYTKPASNKENFNGFAETNYSSWESNNRLPITKTRGNSNDMYVSSSNSLPNYLQGQTIIVKTVKKVKGKAHNHVRTLEQELRPPPSHRLLN